MKKLLCLLLTVLLCFSFVGCGGDDEGKLVIGYTIYEPMNFEKDGKLTGFDTEFAEAVCEKLGLKAEFVEIDWDNKFVILDSDQIDCIWNGMTISDEVKKNCDVSKSYVKNAQVVVMSKDIIGNYTDIASMKSLSFAAEAGSAGEEAVKENGLDAKYTAVKYQTDALMAVKAGQVDACVIDITMAKSSTGVGDYKDIGYSLELTSEEYGIGFRKGSDLTDKVNKAIDELKADGTLDKLAKKYELNLAL